MSTLIQCPLEAWFKRYTPSQQAWNVGATGGNVFIETVELDRDVRQKYSEFGGSVTDTVLYTNGWNPGSDIDVITHEASENTAYSSITDVAKAIGKAAQMVDTTLEPTRVLNWSPHAHVSGTCEVVSYRFLPDASSTTPLSLARENSETAVIATLEHNEQKMITAAANVMYNDPRRRFIMGFTIEEQRMRLWYFCRSHVCVSLPFDFQTEPRDFIRFLLTIIFSTPAELGFDPTVTRRVVERENKPFVAYQYRVRDDYYLTVGYPLSEAAALHLVSRATRVWIAKKMIRAEGKWTGRLEEEGHQYVLKDVWLYDDVRLERDIQTAIFAALEAKDKTGNTTHATDAKPYFMTIIEDWKVNWEDLPLGEDCSAAAPDGWMPARSSSLGQVLATSGPASLCTCSECLKTSETALAHQQRIHVRTVFYEVCQILHEMSDYRTFTKYIIDIVQILRYMRLAGFVHRDVSPGNCLWHGPSGKAKISDLEYARPFSELSGHEPRTGTPSFMAVEYQMRKHLYVPRPRSADPFQPPQPTPKFFNFNYYHDLESVFWLYMWFLHYYPPGALTLDDKTKEILSMSAHKYLVANVDGNSYRSTLMGSTDEARGLAEDLMLVYGIKFYPLLAGISETIGFLLTAFKALEATAPVTVNNEPRRWDEINFQDEVYDQMQEFFARLRETPPFQLGDIPVQPLYPTSDAVENGDTSSSEGKSTV
ncbi:hypothetical protein C8R47DRAFT_1314332 [Mycena vitilis]|nr:hypothetical protein C8R47DRAFT_1314332 [Mycena vitilis]